MDIDLQTPILILISRCKPTRIILSSKMRAFQESLDTMQELSLRFMMRIYRKWLRSLSRSDKQIKVDKPRQLKSSKYQKVNNVRQYKMKRWFRSKETDYRLTYLNLCQQCLKSEVDHLNQTQLCEIRQRNSFLG